MSGAEQRETLRRSVLARRDRLSPARRRRFSRVIADRLWSLPDIQSARTIHLFLSVGSEVETNRVVDEAIRRGLRVVVPIAQMEERRLLLSELSDPSTLAPGPYGIPEPRVESRTLVALDLVDALVVPGIVFDLDGNRLGWGAGYYDRLLETVRSDVPIIGLAYECQIVPAIPTSRHDVKVSAIVTEHRIIQTRHHSPSTTA